MFYSIYGLCPQLPFAMGGFGFSIKLWPSFREAVAAAGLTQQNIDTAIERMGRHWLDACGYDQIYDPDAPRDLFGDIQEQWEKNPKRKYGPSARPLYEPNCSLSVSWGLWGPEHISVPGDACGLDLDEGFGGPLGGMMLLPHNIDNWSQVQLLLITFCWFADHLALELDSKKRGDR